MTDPVTSDPTSGDRPPVRERVNRPARRPLDLSVGVLLVVEASVLIAVLIDRGGIALPVTSSLAGTQQSVAQVDVVVGAVVLLLMGAVARFMSLRSRSARWVEYSFTSSIAVFLVAQLNGISEITTLVPIYALTTGAALFAIVQDRVEVHRGHPMLPLCFGAALGIVPWGLIAFTQIGSGLAGEAPPGLVRAVTLAMLAAAIAFSVTQWWETRRFGAGGDPLGGERAHVILSAVATSVFAQLVTLQAVIAA